MYIMYLPPRHFGLILERYKTPLPILPPVGSGESGRSFRRELWTRALAVYADRALSTHVLTAGSAAGAEVLSIHRFSWRAKYCHASAASKPTKGREGESAAAVDPRRTGVRARASSTQLQYFDQPESRIKRAVERGACRGKERCVGGSRLGSRLLSNPKRRSWDFCQGW